MLLLYCDDVAIAWLTIDQLGLNRIHKEKKKGSEVEDSVELLSVPCDMVTLVVTSCWLSKLNIDCCSVFVSRVTNNYLLLTVC